MTLKEEFIILGYTKDDYDAIRNSYPISSIKDETLIEKVRDNYSFLLKLGYKREEIIKITKSLPEIYGYSTRTIEQKMKDMISLGYTKEEVIRMTKNSPSIYSYSIETIKKKIDDIISLGYTRKEVIKMTKGLSQIYGYSIEGIKQKIDDMISLGYTKEEVIKMTKSFTPIYGLSIESMKQKIDDMISLGYTRKEVIDMTKDLPAIYGYSKKNMKQKKDFYDSIGLHELVSVDPKQLIQSVNLSYARYCFYKDKGIDIDMNNYRKLFVREDQFEKSNGITKQELIEKYDYDKYEEHRKMNL